MLAGKRLFSRIALLRLLTFFFLLALVYVGGTLLIQFGLKALPKDSRPLAGLGGAALLSLVMLGTYVLLVRGLERRRCVEIKLRRGLPQLFAGLLLAFLMIAAVYAVLWANGNAAWQGFTGAGGALSFAALALVSGVGEEVLFRGGVFRVLEDSFGTLVALILSGALFGAVHLANPHASWFSAAAIALEAGVLLGAAYAYTRNLWFAIGIHIGWNFTEGGVFGAAVSGNGGGKGLFNMPLKGPEILTGGAFGPEASLVVLIVCTAAGLYFLQRSWRRGRWVPASFRMMLD
jgi:uncharacterized protein